MTSQAMMTEGSRRVAPRDARLIVGHVLGAALFAPDPSRQETLTWTEVQRCRTLIRRRAEGWPLAYLRRRAAFWDMELAVGPAVLCPRPETELLLELSQQLELPAGSWAIDVGTGSGALAIGLGRLHPHWQVAGTDRSRSALATASENGRKLAPAVRWWWGDLLTPVRIRKLKPTLIVANLPYVAHGARVDREVRREPKAAIWSGADGLSHIRRLIVEAAECLSEDGQLLLEVGWGQAREVAAFGASVLHASATVVPDLAGYGRVVILRKTG